MEQIQAVTPNRTGTKVGGKKNRITSAGRTRYHLGPQKTLLQQYEKLDKTTKQAFNTHFMQSLESAKQTMGQIMQQHIDPEESTDMINQIFPGSMFFGNEQKIMQNMKSQGFNQEMEDLVNKFAGGA